MRRTRCQCDHELPRGVGTLLALASALTLLCCDAHPQDEDLDADREELTDSEPDSDSDSEPDSDSDGNDGEVEITDACVNSRDLSLLEGVEVGEDAGACGLECMSQSDELDCARQCMAARIELSEACNHCFSVLIVCTIDNCLELCSPDPSAEECVECRHRNCQDDFDRCSGLE